MDVNIAGAAVGHDEAEALLIVEELDLSFNHRTAWSRFALAIAAAAAETVAAKAVAATAEPIASASEAITTASKAVTAAAAAKSIASSPPAKAVAASKAIAAAFVSELASRSPRRRRFGRACVDTMNRNDLESPGGILQVTDDRRARREAR